MKFITLGTYSYIETLTIDWQSLVFSNKNVNASQAIKNIITFTVNSNEQEYNTTAEMELCGHFLRKQGFITNITLRYLA